MTRSLAGKTVVLGVSASIAAYKAAYLLRLLMKEGADVYVVMSENAGRFVQPLTFEGLSGHPVAAEVFDTAETASMEHIEKAGRADALVIAPATAGTLGKLACGLAGDALANFFLAWKGPVVIAPAMNDDMYAHPAVQENIACSTPTNKARKSVLPPSGALPCLGPACPNRARSCAME